MDASTQRQSRRGYQLIPEHKDTEIILVPKDAKEQDLKSSSWMSHISLPEGSKFLHCEEDGRNPGQKRAFYGLPWTVEEFTKRALELQHPFNQKVKVAPELAKRWKQMLEAGPKEVIRRRQEQLDHYRRRAKELEAKETELKGMMHDSVSQCVKNKRIELFKEMLQDARYDDMEAADYLVHGVRTVGNLPFCPIWKRHNNRATCPVDALWRNARSSQASMLKGRPSNETDVEVWKATLEKKETVAY